VDGKASVQAAVPFERVMEAAAAQPWGGLPQGCGVSLMSHSHGCARLPQATASAAHILSPEKSELWVLQVNRRVGMAAADVDG
jgi:hypothetical protein